LSKLLLTPNDQDVMTEFKLDMLYLLSVVASAHNYLLWSELGSEVVDGTVA
jgi:hypothetical protein